VNGRRGPVGSALVALRERRDTEPIVLTDWSVYDARKSPARTEKALDAKNARSSMHPTLTSVDYCSDEVYEIDRDRIFHRGWMFLCHATGVPNGTKRVFDVAGESVILARTEDGELHAFANVCRHRGAQLCDRAMNEATRGSIRCQYHAWTYGLDGALRATPRVDDEFDRDDHGLWGHHVDVWNGLVFVSLAPSPAPLVEWLTRWSPLFTMFEDLPVGDYRSGGSTETVVAANWKVLIENYNECLHCAVVHPELVEMIPIYKTGDVVDPARGDEIVDLAPGARALTLDGRSTLSILPGVTEGAEYSGLAIFPNVMFDLTPTVLTLTTLFPEAADRTRVVAEYFFHPDDVGRSDFDPGPEVELDQLVGAQDFIVCEMVQRGVSSSSFKGGVLTRKDSYVADFDRTYLAARGLGEM
jgi:Rieske 2Fe-2S family protein